MITKEDTLLVDLDTLKIIRDQLQEEIKKLSFQRVDILGEIADAKKEVERYKSQLHGEFQAFKQAQESISSGKENELNTKEQNLQAWQNQLANREAATQEVEQKSARLDEALRKAEQESLVLERLRSQAQLEMEKADALKHELESQREPLLRIQEQNKLKLSEIQSREDALVNGEADLSNRLKAVESRERTIDDASRAIDPKLAEIQSKEESITIHEDSVKKLMEDQKAWELRLRELEEQLENKSKLLNEQALKQAQESALLRQRALELQAREGSK